MLFAATMCMAPVQSFKNLLAWQRSVELVDVCFDVVEAIPHPFKFVFASQLLPAAISIPSNIAEGSRRRPKVYLQHLSISLGSHAEVEALLDVIHRRRLVPDALVTRGTSLTEVIGKLLRGLSRSIEIRVQRDRRQS